MKQAYKIIRGIDKLDSEKLFQFRQENVHTRTADDPYHLTQQRSRLDIRRNIFSQRVPARWNTIKYESKSRGIAAFKAVLQTYNWTGGEPDGHH